MASTKKIKDYPQSLYSDGSPVVVNKMRLCYSVDYGVNVLEITLRNVSPLTMYGLSIIIESRDKSGKLTPEGQVEYNYYGIEIPTNRVFGGNEGIVVESEAVDFTVRVIRADFPDDVMFRGDIALEPVPDPKPVEKMDNLFDAFNQEVVSKKPKLVPKFIPEKKSTYWRCTCGRVYPCDTAQCTVCNVDKDWITGIYPNLLAKDKLEKELQKEKEKNERERAERLKAEEAERAAEEERLREEAERLKIQAAELQSQEENKIQNSKDDEVDDGRKKTVRFLFIAAACVVIAVGAFIGIRLIMGTGDNRQQGDTEISQRVAADMNEPETTTEESTTEEPETTAAVTVPETTHEPVDINVYYNDPVTITGVSSAYLNYRSGPGLEYSIIGTLNPGDTFSILGQEGEWYYVDAQNTKGYVHESYVNVTVSVQY